MSKIFCVDDARTLAKRRLPRLIFDFIDGATGKERLKTLNSEAIENIRLQPRVLVNVENRRLKKTFLDQEWGLPFGVAPMGMCNLTWPGADQMLGRAAKTFNIPLALSTAASTTLEEMHSLAEENVWFQLYVDQREQLALDFVQRAKHTGYKVLLLTVDVPQVAPRPRDLKNGFETPFKIRPKQFMDFALHPHWSLKTLKNGIPRTANYGPDNGDKAFLRSESRGRVDWEFLRKLRDLWPGHLVVKGVLSLEDAVKIKNSGADAVYVSNHGGRQLDSGPPAIEMLPKIREAVGHEYPLLFDGGIRNGEGIVKALAMGADFVMVGRSILYGVGACGELGLNRVIEILKNEISLTLAQVGRQNVESIDETVIYRTQINKPA